ncbi:unnamed protein product [Trichobilharzia regenti]|nr:unnamed protein product [Trichobilharzia regenti]
MSISLVRCMNPLFKNLKLLPNDENFDMKKLIISILVEISNDPVAVYVSAFKIKQKINYVFFFPLGVPIVDFITK